MQTEKKPKKKRASSETSHLTIGKAAQSLDSDTRKAYRWERWSPVPYVNLHFRNRLEEPTLQ